jgi:hypothetical protein
MKTIADILKKGDSNLAKLINKSKASGDLERIFHMALDGNLAKYCQFANYKDSELTVVAANTAVAARLRFVIPDIIKQLRIQPEFKDIETIRYTIAPAEGRLKPKKAKLKLSAASEDLWQQTLQELKKQNSKR